MTLLRSWKALPRLSRRLGSRCTVCDRVCVPARRLCPGCGCAAVEPVRLSHHARIVTPTAVHVPPDEHVPEASHAIAVVETRDGTRLVAQVVDCPAEEVKPGVEVRLEFRRVGGDRRAERVCVGHRATSAVPA